MKRLIGFVCAIAVISVVMFTTTGGAHSQYQQKTLSGNTCLSGVAHEDTFFTPMSQLSLISVYLNDSTFKGSFLTSDTSGDWTGCWNMPNSSCSPVRSYKIYAYENGEDGSYGSAWRSVGDGCIAFHANVHAPDGGGR
jgi:hypothetical protein